MTREFQVVAETRGRGFTLIELLVVMFILSLLAGLLLPSLFKAKLLAKKSACMAKFSTLGKAAGLYQAEYKEFVPICAKNHPSSRPYPFKTWRVYLYPYISVVDAFNCPAASGGREIIQSFEEMASPDNASFSSMNLGSYAGIYHVTHDTYKTLNYAGNMENAAAIWSCAVPVTPGVFWKNPDDSVYLLDGCVVRGDIQYPTQPPHRDRNGIIVGATSVPWPDGSCVSYMYWFTDQNTYRFCDRHLGTNCLFLDGRVEEYATEELDNMTAGNAECVWDWY